MIIPPAPVDDGLLVAKEPGERSQAWMAALGTGLLLGGVALGLLVLGLRGLSDGVIIVTAEKALRMVLGTVLVGVGTVILHELLHGLGMLVLKARPRFGAGVMSPGLPYLYTTCEGHLFTRWQYIVICALPNVVINLTLLALIAGGPAPSWWVIPLGLHMSGGVGDMWLCWAALTEPPGTRVEDQRAGVRVLRPDGA
ncbi:DUF3267 domain-containing protein [Luteococcus sp. Sow4_B9]|uniref:DUF3267 domain-containing protein n=1 Tax=Luteococcus sp. Sow4_B9 TaxID=3438792 RepID=UPI003F9C1738